MAQILLAEDDDSMRNFLTLALSRAGHTVTATQDGLEALTELEQNDHFQLLLTDIVMPGMDGIELSQLANKKRPALKIMFITGFSAMAMGQETANQPKARIMSKPFHLNDLVSNVDSLLKAA